MRQLPVLVLAACLCHPALAAPEAIAEAGAPGMGATAAPKEVAAIRAAEHRRAMAVARRDVDALRQLIGGEYYHVESNGRVRTKTEFLQALARNEFRLSGYGVDDMEINMVGDGRAAVVTGRFHAQMQTLHTVRQFRGRYVRVWTLQPDGWRNTLHQSTEIRPAAATPPGEPRTLPLQ